MKELALHWLASQILPYLHIVNFSGVLSWAVCLQNIQQIHYFVTCAIKKAFCLAAKFLFFLAAADSFCIIVVNTNCLLHLMLVAFLQGIFKHSFTLFYSNFSDCDNNFVRLELGILSYICILLVLSFHFLDANIIFQEKSFGNVQWREWAVGYGHCTNNRWNSDKNNQALVPYYSYIIISNSLSAKFENNILHPLPTRVVRVVQHTMVDSLEVTVMYCVTWCHEIWNLCIQIIY